MALQQINVGTTANDNTGDTLRAAFVKVNSNTTDLLLSVTTSADSTFNGVKIGKGAGNISGNTSVGVANLTVNTTGTSNTSVGSSALALNQTGGNNTALGTNSLINNVSGNDNTSLGFSTLVNSLLSKNTAVGYTSLYNNSGHTNTGLGYAAGSNNSAGHNNITCLGANSQPSASNQVNLGDTSVTSLRCNVTSITSLSDERDKKDILEISEGLDFVSKLKPVTFTWNQRDGNREGIKAAGFIAQDLLELQNDSSIGENLDLVSDSNPEQLEARYTNLMPVMIKAIQELKAEIELLKAK